MRYGGLITLIEHRRCVPEIIGFSNRSPTSPTGSGSMPVRQYGADRLEPIKPVSRHRRLHPRHHQQDQPSRGRRHRRPDREVHRRPPLRRPDLRRDLAARQRPGARPSRARCSNGSRPRSGQHATCAAATLRTSRAPNATSCSCPWSPPPNPVRRLGGADPRAVRPALQRRRLTRQGPDVAVPLDRSWTTSATPRTCGSRSWTTATASSTAVQRGRPRRPQPTSSRTTSGSSRSTRSSSNASSTVCTSRGYTVIPQYPAQGYRIDLVVVGRQDPSRRRVRRRHVARPGGLRARPRPAARPGTLRLGVLPNPRVRLLRRPTGAARRPLVRSAGAQHSSLWPGTGSTPAPSSARTAPAGPWRPCRGSAPTRWSGPRRRPAGCRPRTAGRRCCSSSRMMRLVAQVDEAVLPRHASRSSLGVVVADDRDQLRRRLRLPDPLHRRPVDVLLVDQPLEELLQPLVLVQRGRRRPGLDHPRLERLDVRPGHLARVVGRGVGVRIRRVLGEVAGRAARRRGGSCSGWSPDSSPSAATGPSRGGSRPRSGTVRR